MQRRWACVLVHIQVTLDTPHFTPPVPTKDQVSVELAFDAHKILSSAHQDGCKCKLRMPFWRTFWNIYLNIRVYTHWPSNSALTNIVEKIFSQVQKDTYKAIQWSMVFRVKIWKKWKVDEIIIHTFILLGHIQQLKRMVGLLLPGKLNRHPFSYSSC